MFATLRATLVTKIVDHLCDVQAKALVHLVQPVIVQVAAELREAVASGRGMTNDEVEARAADLLKPMLEAEEQAMGDHIAQMVGASRQANASSRVPSPLKPSAPTPVPTGSDADNSGGASAPTTTAVTDMASQSGQGASAPLEGPKAQQQRS